MAMKFVNDEDKCEDCGFHGTQLPLAYQVVETKHLCFGCAEKRASRILVRDGPCKDTRAIGKTLSLECKHCAVGICGTCERAVLKELKRLSLEECKVIRDIKDKSSLRVAKEIELPGDIKFPRLCCLTEDTKVAVVDADSGALYLIDLDSGEVVRIVSNSPVMAVSDCATACRKELVFSNLAFGCLTLCDMSGKSLCNLPLPDRKPMKEVLLGMNADGNILAGRRGEPNIHAINPLTEQVIATASLKGKSIARGIQATPSNKIIVGSEWAEFVVLDANGQQVTIKDGNWFKAECACHPTEDLLYVLYSKTGADPQTVYLDEVTLSGEIRRKSILSFKLKGPLSRPLITPQMELVVCSGRTILIFE